VTNLGGLIKLALLINASYYLSMEKKILRVQLYSLFVLTTLNLIYFYYRDNLPDNYYEITYQNHSINFFTYYFFSLLANFGYWCGIWVTVSFIVFALLHTFVLTKKKDVKNQIVIAALMPLTLSLCFFIIPETLGEGLFFLIKENISALTLVSSILLFGAGFFYLVSEKNFFKTCRWVWKQIVKLGTMIKEADYSAITSIEYKKIPMVVKERFVEFVARFKKEDEIAVAAAPVAKKLKITESPKIKEAPAQRSLPVAEPVEIEEEDEEEIVDEVVDEDGIEEVEDGDEEEINDSIDEEAIEEEELEESDEEEFEKVASPFQKKVKVEETFFDADELISCLAPKNQINKISDPSDVYFTTIARAIEEKLKEFHISANVINVLKGPVVDTFELELGAGVKVAGVTNRTDDLSLALMGAPIRMVYPMRGKSTIGIEVPRNPRDVIYLDEVLKSPNFNNSSYRLPIAMGKDAYGDAAVIDLAATPHLLVAGTTGAGKSVFINTLLVSLIIKFSPKKLRLIMLDPKQLELALYQRLPHLIMPVVTDPQIASVALLWAIDEMERRYSLLKDFAVKNIDGFNKKVQTAGTDLTCRISKYYPDAETQDFELPFIVVVVDEFADLMLSKSGKAIETSISRLAAKARASGIHIVLATQRPSTDIITGVIKANFPTRVSFRVFTNIDSRVILDGMGAEKLLGKGDMLFKQGIDILRMHSAYVDENEIEALVDKLATIPIQYDTDAMEFIQNNGVVDTDVEGITTDGEGGGLKDEKYDEAVRCVAMHRVASASFLQRRLGVGYNRAANLIEEMERHGIVGPAQGSKPRKVLVPPPSDSTP
jgi:S-DNA-T family DNA segregation ATPase FtsK/SpoIIIE